MINQVFMEWNEPILWQAEQFLIDNILFNKSYSERKTKIFAPSKRSSRRLVELLCLRLKNNTETPNLFEICLLSSLPSFLTNTKKLEISRTESLHFWQVAFDKAVEHDPNISELFKSFKEGSHAFYFESVRKELSSYGLKPTDVLQHIEENYTEINRQNWEGLNNIWQLYEQELESLNVIDAFSDFYSLSPNLPLESSYLMVLVSCFNLPHAVDRFLENSNLEIISLIPAPETKSSGFSRCGRIKDSYWSEEFPVISQDKLVITQSDNDQLEYLKIELDALKKSKFPESLISIVTLDSSLLGPLEDTISSCALKSVAPGTRSLKNSSLGLLILEIARCFAYGDRNFINLFKHPVLSNYLKDQLGIDQTYFAEVVDLIKLKTTDENLKTSAELKGDIKNKIKECEKVFANLNLSLELNAQTLSEYIAKIELTLFTLIDGCNANQDFFPENDLVKAKEVFDDLKFQVTDTEIKILPQAFVSVLENYLYAKDLGTENNIGIEILGLLESFLDDSQGAYYLNCTEEFLPGKTVTDPLLPNQLRTTLGIDSEKTFQAQCLLFLNANIASKKRVIFYAPTHNNLGDQSRLSKLLVLGDRDNLKQNLENFYLNETPPKNPNTILPAETSPLIDLELLKNFNLLSASRIKSYLRCPYTFYLNYILKVELFDYDLLELDGRQTGSILHALFHEINLNQEIKSSNEVLEKFYAIAGRHLGRSRNVRIDLQLKLLEKKVSAYYDWHTNSLKEGWHCIESEYKLPEQSTIMVDSSISLKFTGIVDRIDFHPKNNLIRIIDFKTGDRVYGFKDAVKKSGWKDPQLPLYAEFLKRDLNARFSIPPENIQLMYVSLIKGSEAKTSFETFSDHMGKTVLDVGKDVARNILAGKFWPPAEDNEMIKRIFGHFDNIPLRDEDVEETEQ